MNANIGASSLELGLRDALQELEAPGRRPDHPSPPGEYSAKLTLFRFAFICLHSRFPFPLNPEPGLLIRICFSILAVSP
jgi:hypothetical protein